MDRADGIIDILCRGAAEHDLALFDRDGGEAQCRADAAPGTGALEGGLQLLEAGHFGEAFGFSGHDRGFRG